MPILQDTQDLPERAIDRFKGVPQSRYTVWQHFFGVASFAGPNLLGYW